MIPCVPCLSCRLTQSVPTICHPCSSLETLAVAKHVKLESRGRHSEAGWLGSICYILNKIARGENTPMPIYFLKGRCVILLFAFFFFFNNYTTFENYISCNDLILLIAIQKKTFPPSQQPSRGD